MGIVTRRRIQLQSENVHRKKRVHRTPTSEWQVDQGSGPKMRLRRCGFRGIRKKWGRVMVFSNKTVSVFPEEWSSKHFKQHKEVNLQDETKLFL